jgi:type I restriction enzyme, S subunit
LKFQKCIDMNDSEVDWIGNIPKHWKISKLLHVLELHQIKNNDSITRKMLSVSQTLGIIEKEYGYESQIRTKEDSLDYLVVHPTNLVVNKMWIQYRGLGVSFIEGIVSPAYRIYKINSKIIEPKFLNYLVRSDIYLNEYPRHLKGIRPNSLEIIENVFVRLPLILPPLTEQQQITKYLDVKIQKINYEIKQNKNLIYLLNEKRKISINQVMIKGMIPDISMKNSGIKWIGQIPKHWSLLPVTSLLKPGKEGIRIGPFGSSITLNFIKEYGYRIYGQQNITKENFDLGTHHIDEEKFLELKDYELLPNDIAISRMGTIGKAVVVPKNIVPGIMHSHIIRLRVDLKKCFPLFLTKLINSSHYVDSYFKSISDGATMQGLNVSSIKSCMICVPPVDEQKQISEFLDTMISKIDSLILKLTSQIEKLEKYQHSLISSMITGKICIV